MMSHNDVGYVSDNLETYPMQVQISTPFANEDSESVKNFVGTFRQSTCRVDRLIPNSDVVWNRLSLFRLKWCQDPVVKALVAFVREPFFPLVKLAQHVEFLQYRGVMTIRNASRYANDGSCHDVSNYLILKRASLLFGAEQKSLHTPVSWLAYRTLCHINCEGNMFKDALSWRKRIKSAVEVDL